MLNCLWRPQMTASGAWSWRVIPGCWSAMSSFKAFHVSSMDKAIHWVNIEGINPSSSFYPVLHRWTERVKDETAFCTASSPWRPDGFPDMRLLNAPDHPAAPAGDGFDPSAVGTFDYEKSPIPDLASRYGGTTSIIIVGPHAGRSTITSMTMLDGGDVRVVGQRSVLVENGHMTFSPVDPLAAQRHLSRRPNARALPVSFSTCTGRRHNLGSFTPLADLNKGKTAVTMHPCWSRDGRQVCVDSVHEHQRQMYVLDVCVDCGKQPEYSNGSSMMRFLMIQAAAC